MDIPTKNQIKDILLDVNREMILIYKNGGREGKWKKKWRDGANEEGLVISEEALMSFLLPAHTIPEIKEKIFFKIMEKDVLLELLNKIIQFSSDDFYGSPYIDMSKYAKDGKNRGFVDGACFLVSDVLLLKKLLWDELPDELKTKLDILFEKALEFINDSYIPGNSWSWGPFDKPAEGFVYSTYMVFESVSDLLEIDLNGLYFTQKSKDLINELGIKLKKVLSFLENKYVNPFEKNEYNKDITKGTVAYTEIDRALHYNLWIVLSLLIGGSKKQNEIEQAIGVIIDDFTEDKHIYLSRPFVFSFDSKEIIKNAHFSDRTFLPLLLKALSLFVKIYPEKYEDYKETIFEVYNLLLLNRDTDKYLFVWDKYAENDTGYAIYYTERAIEALCRLYQVLPDKVDDFSERSIEDIIKVLINRLYPVEEIEKVKKKFSLIENRIENLEKNILSAGRSEDAIEMIERYDTIKALIEEGKIEEAEAKINQALQKHPNNEIFTNLKEQIEKAKRDGVI